MMVVCRVAFVAAICLPAAAQTAPSAAEIVRRVDQTYAQTSQFDFAGTSHGLVSGVDVVMSFRIAAKEGKTRIEMLSSAPAGASGAVLVEDGKCSWSYQMKGNQYSRGAQITDSQGMHLTALMTSLFQATPESAKIIREEAIEIDGESRDCFVIEISRPWSIGLSTWWIDKKRYIVLREDAVGKPDSSVTSSMVWHTTKLNELISDDVFVFIPPTGARQVQ